MRIILKKVVAKLAVLAFMASATAVESKPLFIYGNISYLIGSYKEQTKDGYLNSVFSRIGSCYYRWCAEGRLGQSINQISGKDPLGEDIDVGPDTFSGLYGLYKYDTGKGLKPYLLVGMSKSDIQSISGEKLNESGISYGFGTEFLMTKKIIGTFEYISYLDKDRAKFSGVGIGVGIEYGF